MLEVKGTAEGGTEFEFHRIRISPNPKSTPRDETHAETHTASFLSGVTVITGAANPKMGTSTPIRTKNQLENKRMN